MVWSELAKLPDDTIDGDESDDEVVVSQRFGVSVSFAGDETVVTGSPFDSEKGSRAGCAYSFGIGEFLM